MDTEPADEVLFQERTTVKNLHELIVQKWYRLVALSGYYIKVVIDRAGTFLLIFTDTTDGILPPGCQKSQLQYVLYEFIDFDYYDFNDICPFFLENCHDYDLFPSGSSKGTICASKKKWVSAMLFCLANLYYTNSAGVDYTTQGINHTLDAYYLV